MTDKEAVLFILCRQSFIPGAEDYLTSSGRIQWLIQDYDVHISRYKVLKYLHELRDEGYVKYDSNREYNNYAERYSFNNGWRVLRKAGDTTPYYLALEEESKAWEDQFGNQDEARQFMDWANKKQQTGV